MYYNYIEKNEITEITDLIKNNKIKITIFVKSLDAFHLFINTFSKFLITKVTSNSAIFYSEIGGAIELYRFIDTVSNFRGKRTQILIIEDTYSIKDVEEKFLPMMTIPSIHNKVFIFKQDDFKNINF